MCGVFAAALPRGSGSEASNVAALGLFALQHRGQESAGVAVADGSEVVVYKDLGMIAQVLDERRLPAFRGDLAIAHCRYSTTGSTVWENAQPTLRLGPRRAVAIGHNGNLVNTRELLASLRGGRGRLPASTDTELLTEWLVSDSATRNFIAGNDPIPISSLWKNYPYPADHFENSPDTTGIYQPLSDNYAAASKTFHGLPSGTGSTIYKPWIKAYFSILDRPTAARFALPLANLVNAAGAAPVPDDNGILAGYAAMHADSSGFKRALSCRNLASACEK